MFTSVTRLRLGARLSVLCLRYTSSECSECGHIFYKIRLIQMFASFFERSIGSLIFYPSSKFPDGLRYLDIGLGAEGDPAVHEDRLDDASIRTWIDESGRREPTDQGRLRLVLAGRPGYANLFDHFPFSQETFMVIFREFELPGIYPATLITKLPHYSHSASRNSAGNETVSFVSRTFYFRKAGHALALTYNVRTKTTSAMIQGPREAYYLASLCRYLKERPDMVVHPAYLLMVVAQLEYETTNESYLPLRGGMIHIEKWTGHGQLAGRDAKENPNLFQDLPAVTRELNLFSSKVIGETERIKSCLLRHEQILQFMDQVDEASSLLTMSSHSGELRQHAEFLATGWEAMLHRYEAFEKNVQVQLAVLYSTAVQRDSKLNLDVAISSANIAAATRHDGSVMKGISLLTMVFLPATFVSTLFAMPLFDWSADRVDGIATPYAWIYLAVALPLTFAVVAIWFAWMWYKGRVQKLEVQTEMRDGDKEKGKLLSV